MNLEKENTEKRKNQPLSNLEALSFFLFPIGFAKLDKRKSSDFNESELERYKNYGFELKIKQASQMKKYGFIFYVSIGIILAYLLS